ncbi:hypothetical protein [Streptomyces lydicus]|uniref:hypothetical protein n=1 Tax=Streptomyces lydicus TaxID=47763 RepID=UPI00341FD548
MAAVIAVAGCTPGGKHTGSHDSKPSVPGAEASSPAAGGGKAGAAGDAAGRTERAEGAQ